MAGDGGAASSLIVPSAIVVMIRPPEGGTRPPVRPVKDRSEPGGSADRARWGQTPRAAGAGHDAVVRDRETTGRRARLTMRLWRLRIGNDDHTAGITTPSLILIPVPTGPACSPGLPLRRLSAGELCGDGAVARWRVDRPAERRFRQTTPRGVHRDRVDSRW
jgi:hypothetical protein